MVFKLTSSVKALNQTANKMRIDIIRMVCAAGSGHTAGSLGMADVFAALYFGIAKHDPKNPRWDGRDRIILSNGHICPVLYAALAECGYFQKEKLITLRKLGSPLQGHPHLGALPGIESSSGPLGQGLSQACGIALALKMDKKDNLVFCLTSDGEHQEGQTWEAAMFASKFKLANVVQIMDRNNIQIDGKTEDIMPLEPLRKKYEAFGWDVIEVEGNNMQKVYDALLHASKKAREKPNSKPIIIIANTIAGKGILSIEGDYKWHGIAPKAEEAKKMIEELELANKDCKTWVHAKKK
ncbi:MAG: transketolase [Candidatus Micrarchaeia archaeon]